MNKEQLAALLNGREIGSEITDSEEQQAARNGPVVIFGASDDLCELRGAINDELSACEGCTVLIGHDGRLLAEIDDQDIEVLDKYEVLAAVRDRHRGALKINARWCATPEYSWTFETDVPHATFDVMEGEEKYCRGIVVDLRGAA